MTNEIWKQLPELPYEVSSHGRMRRMPRLMRPVRSGNGYLQSFVVTGDGKRVGKGIHRWVMEAFVGPCPPGFVVNHKNGIKTDNRPENLEYVTPRENRRHATETGLQDIRGEKSLTAKLSEADVRKIRELRARTGMTFRALGDMFGISDTQACNIVKRASWAHVK